MAQFPSAKNESLRRFYFIGVTTERSSMRRIFPRWCEALNLDAELVEVDLPLDTPATRYRDVLEEIRKNDEAVGALVTSHKLNLLQSAPDLFAQLAPDSIRLKEVSCIVRRSDGTLTGSATDALTSILSLHHIVPERYWSETGAEILCLGVGGSGQAFTLGLLTRYPVECLPRRIHLVARNERRIEQACSVLHSLAETHRVAYHLAVTPEETDALVLALPPGSLIANATGMGKDVPGSPLSDAAQYPVNGIAWDFNYRGDLTFLRQAEGEVEDRGVKIHDGWIYFLYGWMHVMAEVFGFEVTPEVFRTLAGIAETYR